MPEYIHLLISESDWATPSRFMQVVKQRFAQRILRRRKSAAQLALWPAAEERRIWQPRFYDFNVWSGRKREEKLHYMHQNPVRRGLARQPGDWRWSSFRSYGYGEPGAVRINSADAGLGVRRPAA